VEKNNSEKMDVEGSEPTKEEKNPRKEKKE